MNKIICESTGEIVYSYDAYLNTEHWANIKLDLIDERCLVCDRNPTQIHHITYERLGCEIPDDFIALCGKHHMKLHKIRKSRLTKREKFKKRTRELRNRNKKMGYKIKKEGGLTIKVY